jgi:hypothetical protein
MRPIPKVDYLVVQKAVSKAIQDGALWLVFGNDSVYKEAPAPVQMDADALLFRPPVTLAAIDFLPTALPDAWTKDAEPKTTVAEL